MGHKRVRAGGVLLAGVALLAAILRLTAGPPVYTAARVQDGLLHHAQTWEGRTVLVRAVETGWITGKLCLSPDYQSNCGYREQLFLGPVTGAKTPDLRVLGTHDPRDVSGEGLPSHSILPARWATLPLLGPLLTALLPPTDSTIYRIHFPRRPLYCWYYPTCIFGEVAP